jgi:cell division protein FtsL
MKSPALRPRHGHGTSVWSTLRALLPPALLVLLFVVVGVVHVTSRILVVSAGYELSRIEAQHRRLSLENDRLKLELATLKSPARLERHAREKLGMGPPAPAAVLSWTGGSPRRSQPPPAESFAAAGVGQ